MRFFGTVCLYWCWNWNCFFVAAGIFFVDSFAAGMVCVDFFAV